MRGLQDRAFVVTGGASGIGRATCERLAAEGAGVAIVDRNEALATALADEIAGRGGRAIALGVDVSREAEARDAIGRAARDLGPIAGLVTSAGIFDPGDMRLLADVDVETFERTLGVNLVGTFLFAKHVIPRLLEPRSDGSTGGSIVTIASTAGLRGHGFGSGYTASKGGVVALTRLLALQYGERGIRANCVCPGLTRTPMTGGAYDDPDAVRRVIRGIPLGRIAEASEIGDLVCTLLSDEARYVTGQVIAADGGATVM